MGFLNIEEGLMACTCRNYEENIEEGLLACTCRDYEDQIKYPVRHNKKKRG